jgi:hypothetical protein
MDDTHHAYISAYRCSRPRNPPDIVPTFRDIADSFSTHHAYISPHVG